METSTPMNGLEVKKEKQTSSRMNSNPIYSGENSAVKLPELDAIERSSRRSSEMQIRGEEMMLEKSLKDKDAFLKMMKIDPVLAISKTNQIEQALMLTRFNNKWGAREQRASRRGGLSIADQLEQQTDKGELIAFQNKVLNDQEQLKQMITAVSQDTRVYWDHTKFYKDLLNYKETGVLPVLDVKPQSMESWLQGQKKDVAREPGVEEIPIMQNGKPTGRFNTIQTGTVTLQTAQNTILRGMEEPARMKKVLIDHENWLKTAPQKDVYDLYKDFDANKNGIIDPTEFQYAHQNTDVRDNPIAKWAMNNPSYLTEIMDIKEGTAKNIPQKSGVNVGSDSATIMDGTRKVSYYVPKAAPVYLGANYHSEKYYTLPTNTAPRGISLNTPDPNAVKVLTEGLENTVKRPPVISAIVTGYDVQNDVFTFDVRRDFSNIGINGIEVGNGMQIAVPRKALNNTDFLDSFVVLDESGKKVKIGDLDRTAQTVAPSSGVNWKISNKDVH